MNCLNSLRERERKLTTRFLVFGGAFAGAFFLTPVESERTEERMVYQPSQNSKKSEKVGIRRTTEIIDRIDSLSVTDCVSVESRFETLLSCFDLQQEGKEV